MSIFKRRKPAREPVIPEGPVEYPQGTCVETESGKYLINGGKRFRIKHDAIFKSWNFPLVVKSTDKAIAHYPSSLRPLPFRDGTVVRDIYNLELFVFSGGKRIKIVSVEMFEHLGLEDSKIPMVSHEIVRAHPEGGTI